MANDPEWHRKSFAQRRRDEEIMRHHRAMEDQGRRMERIARGQHPDGNIVTRTIKRLVSLCVILFVLFVIFNGLMRS